MNQHSNTPILQHALTPVRTLHAPTPPSYPARPLNGGPLPKALPKSGTWIYEPKYNGWRALVHIPTGAMFNRRGQPLTIAAEFKPAVEELHLKLGMTQCFEWADCEALDRRHGLGRGSLIVLDVVPEPPRTLTPYSERRTWLEAVPRELPFTSFAQSFPVLSIPPTAYNGTHRNAAMAVWCDLQRTNAALHCDFYEGLVAKRADSVYPIQLRSPDAECPFWIKYRWAW